MLQNMQIIKQNTSYALRALLHMAAAPEDDSFTAEQLAEAAGTTTDFMHKIMQSLGQADLVISQRGPGGGFRLARPPEEVCLLDITGAVQGPLTVSRCIMGLDLCDRSDNCPLRATWEHVQGLVERALTETSLADILGRAGKKDDLSDLPCTDCS